jgi:hypothetical protein
MTELENKTGGLPNISPFGMKHARSRLTPTAKLKGG